MKIKFALDGVQIDDNGRMASCDRLHAFSIINSLLFQLACTDSSQADVAPNGDIDEDISRGERLPPRP